MATPPRTPREGFWFVADDLQLQIQRMQLRLNTIRHKVAHGNAPTENQLGTLTRYRNAMKSILPRGE